MQFFHLLLQFPTVEVKNRFYFTFTGVQGVKKSFQEVRIKILSYKTNVFGKKNQFSCHFFSKYCRLLLSKSQKLIFFYIHRSPGGKNLQVLHKNNQCFQHCTFCFRSRGVKKIRGSKKGKHYLQIHLDLGKGGNCSNFQRL